MPEASIVVSFRDQYTAGVRRMSDSTRAFSQETQQMITRLQNLGSRQDWLVQKQARLRSSIREVQEAMKQLRRDNAANPSAENEARLN